MLRKELGRKPYYCGNSIPWVFPKEEDEIVFGQQYPDFKEGDFVKTCDGNVGKVTDYDGYKYIKFDNNAIPLVYHISDVKCWILSE